MRAPGKPSLAGACWAQTEDPSGCGAASPRQGRWDPDSLRTALRLGVQATAGERSPGRSLCLTKSSACGRLWQFAHPRPLSLLQRGLWPGEQSRVVSPNGRGGWTPLRPLMGLQENRVEKLTGLPRDCTGHSKHPLPTTQEKTLHMDPGRTPQGSQKYINK